MEYLDYIKFKDFLTPSELKSILQLADQREQVSEHITKITSKRVSGRYTLQVLEVSEDLSPKEQEANMKVLYGHGVYNGKTGTYVASNRGYEIQDIIGQLFERDALAAQSMMQKYHSYAARCEDVLEMVEQLHHQMMQMFDYLKEQQIECSRYQVDYQAMYQMQEDELEAAIGQIYSERGDPPEFERYNDLDFQPMMMGANYAIMDYSSDNFFLCRKTEQGYKIYSISDNYTDSGHGEMHDYFCDFEHDYGDRFYRLADNLNERHLIAEISGEKVTKASYSLQSFHLMQSFICEELMSEGKIVDFKNYPIVRQKRELEQELQPGHITDTFKI